MVAALSTLPAAFTKTEFGSAFQWPSPPVRVAGEGAPLDAAPASVLESNTTASVSVPQAATVEPGTILSKTTAPNGITTEVSQSIAAPVIPVAADAKDLPQEKMATPAILKKSEPEPSLLDKLHDLLVEAKVGQTVAVAPTSPNAPNPKLSVLEEYDAASGERCRRFAWFEADTERGIIQTACRVNDEGEWVALRSMSHETMSPLATLPPSATALLHQEQK